LLAAAIARAKSFISGVLNGKAHSAWSKPIKSARFFASDDEREFFLLLVQLGRAGSKELESFFKRKVQSVLAGRREVSERITPSARLTDVEQLTYYSSWQYTAVHMCLVPGAQGGGRDR